MRTSKYSEEQIIGFLRQAEAGMPIKEIGRKHGFSDASFYKWRSKRPSWPATRDCQTEATFATTGSTTLR